jgi:hypothetical protein
MYYFMLHNRLLKFKLLKSFAIHSYQKGTHPVGGRDTAGEAVAPVPGREWLPSAFSLNLCATLGGRETTCGFKWGACSLNFQVFNDFSDVP